MNPPDRKADPLAAFLDSYSRDLLEMSDAEVLNGVNGAAEQADGLELLKSAKAEAAARRLNKARERLQQPWDLQEMAGTSIAEARAYLRQAANDTRYGPSGIIGVILLIVVVLLLLGKL